MSFAFLCLPGSALADVAVSSTAPTVTLSSPTLATPPALLTLLHPLEGMKLPPLTQVFAYGQVAPGSTLTINGLPVNIHPKGGYLTMVPLTTGENSLLAVVLSSGTTGSLSRRVWVSSGFVPIPLWPVTIEKFSLAPTEDQWLAAGDTVRVSFQGSSGGTATFEIDGVAKHIPMLEVGVGSATARGIYQGSYVLQAQDHAQNAAITVALKRGNSTVRQKANGRLTVSNVGVVRVGMITDDNVAVRTGPEGGYDFFLSRGMKVRLTGKVGNQWRIRVSDRQSGWVRDSAIIELAPGTLPAQSHVSNFTVTHQAESTLIRVPLSEPLPWRSEQTLNPMQLVVTLYGGIDRTNLIRYDPSDPTVQLVRWRQAGPDTVQVVIDPTFHTWWGYDVRYEGSTLVIDIRDPWKSDDLRGLPIAIDPGHGGSDAGAIGALGTLEKNANLAMAMALKNALEKAGARVFMTRDRDMDVPLQERGRLAWRAGARLFISVHANASGVEENPIWNNGFSVYFYHPQSQALAKAIHSMYRRSLAPVNDHGLYYDDLAVCRTIQMPAVLLEEAYIIVPEQEQLLLDPEFQKRAAAAAVNGVRAFVEQSRR